ncbi:DUF2752 domain-containing protein [Cellulomonas timonensis]|uniref:DUF2752 domain-containing protein n=1 Tax=Cellulomonas timonensis TaxID=1689271 RepID=UPI000A8995B3|nr:DUF2752 domain-containing protein [Cellulomonas timonensis]
MSDLQPSPLPDPGAGWAASGAPQERGASRGRLERMLAPGAVALAIAVGTACVALVDPHTPGQYGVCPLLALTGLYCAGCGGLRATHDLATGDLAGAWAMNPLWVLAVPLVAVLWGRWALRRWRGTPRPVSARSQLWPAWLFLVVVLGYSALRNVPDLAPWLAP